MTEAEAVAAFAALSEETRLRVPRLLVEAGPDGMAAGAIGEIVGATSSNLSFHLKELRAGLVTSRRRSRSILYAASIPGIGALVRFLTEDCCRGRPDLCGPSVRASWPRSSRGTSASPCSGIPCRPARSSSC